MHTKPARCTRRDTATSPSSPPGCGPRPTRASCCRSCGRRRSGGSPPASSASAGSASGPWRPSSARPRTSSTSATSATGPSPSARPSRWRSRAPGRQAPTSSTRARRSCAPRWRAGSPRDRARHRRLHGRRARRRRCAPGCRGERSALHGNDKSDAGLRRALTAGVGRIVVDSLEEVDRVADVAGGWATRRAPARHGRRRGAHPRVHRHRPRGPEVRALDRPWGHRRRGGPARAGPAPELQLTGAAAHIGSQIFDTGGVRGRRSVASLQLHAAIAASTASTCAELDLGGGFGIAYASEHDPLPPKGLAEGMAAIVRRECDGLGVGCSAWPSSRARAIAGPSTFTVSGGGRGAADHGARRRRRRRRHQRRHPDSAVRRRATVHARLTRVVRAGRPCPCRGQMSRAATSWCATSSCRATPAAATWSPSPGRRAPAAAAWRARPTTCRGRRSWRCATARPS